MKKRKVWTVILIIIILIPIILLKLGDLYVENKLKDFYLDKNEQLRITIDHPSINLLGKSIELKGITLTDTEDISTGTIKYIKVNDIHFLDLLFKKKFIARSLDIQTPNIRYHQLEKLKSDTSSTLPEIIIDNYRLDSANIDLIIPSKNGLISVLLDNGYISVHYDADDQLDLERSKLAWDGIEYKNDGGYYKFKTGLLETDIPNSILILDSLQMIPQLGKREFAQRAGFRKSRTELNLEYLTIYGLDYHALLTHKSIFARKVLLENPSVSIFSNKHLPPPPPDSKYIPLPQEALAKSDMNINIDSVQLLDGYLNYISLNPHAETEGSIDFHKMYLSIHNITNLENQLEQNNLMHMDVAAYVRNKGKLDVHFSFPLEDPNYTFSWHGTLGKMTPTTANSYTLPVLNFKIEEGELDYIKFDVVSDSEVSKGTVECSYNGLKARVIDQEQQKEKKLLTFLANALAVKKNNIPGTNSFVVGNFTYEREKYRAFEHYIWISIEHGILYTLLPKSLADEATSIHRLDREGNIKKGKTESSRVKQNNLETDKGPEKEILEKEDEEKSSKKKKKKKEEKRKKKKEKQ